MPIILLIRLKLINILIRQIYKMRWVMDKIITGFFVLVFGSFWFFSTKFVSEPKQYRIFVIDSFGNEINIEGLRTIFKNREVASSFIHEYQKSYPMCNFMLADYLPVKYQRRVVCFFMKLISYK